MQKSSQTEINSPPMTIAEEEQHPASSVLPRKKPERQRIRSLVCDYVLEHRLVPPLSLNTLRRHSEIIAASNGLPENLTDFITVLINNKVWEKTIASIPFHRRVLLLPHCFRTKSLCPAGMDKFGLLCEQCGQCETGRLQAEAEALGYVVLIAEGTTMVTKLLESGQVDCVIGASCMDSLERSFPYTAAAAVPGIAIPLYRNGCDNTKADFDWITEAIRLHSDESLSTRLNLDKLRVRIRQWFEKDTLSKILQLHQTQTERLTFDWMAAGGKRWRPFLAAAVYETLADGAGDETIQKLAVAVECFHKASLVHDDIEDDDARRYGEATLHKKYGVPVALNIGDLLLGEGYRLIADCGAENAQIARMLKTASAGHKELCLGQGEELNWMRQPVPLAVDQVLNIFRGKTAPAFEVSLNLGAIAAHADEATCGVLKQFSEALGIAYQIRDDIEDFIENGGDSDIEAMRPSLLLALALKNADCEIRRQLTMIQRKDRSAEDRRIIQSIVHKMQIEDEAWRMFEDYRDQSLDILESLTDQQLKSLLFRIVYKILKSTTGSVRARQPSSGSKNRESNSERAVS